MDILGFLKRKGARKKPLPPIKTIRPPGEARAKNQVRLAREFEESGAFLAEQKAEEKFLDTGPLELQDEQADKGDPYATHSWQKDPEQGLRRVEDQSLINRERKNERKKKVKVTSGNPYDTSVMKKGW